MRLKVINKLMRWFITDGEAAEVREALNDCAKLNETSIYSTDLIMYARPGTHKRHHGKLYWKVVTGCCTIIYIAFVLLIIPIHYLNVILVKYLNS